MCLLLGETALFPVPEPINQCGEKVVFRQVFSGENVGNGESKRRNAPLIQPFKKMSLEMYKVTQRLLKFS